MRFTISREVLIKPLQLVAGVVERRHTLAVLANILVSVKTVNYLWLAVTLKLKSWLSYLSIAGLNSVIPPCPLKSFGHLQKLAGWFQYRFHLR